MLSGQGEFRFKPGMSVIAETQEIFMSNRHCLKNGIILREGAHNTALIKNNPFNISQIGYLMFWIVNQSVLMKRCKMVSVFT